ncbi:cell wall metabolism sensor histidine kinase WalK [Arthrobacter sp. M4]|uniref:sensor histidine kinase n=1 Tax=Arthrobacter sp. M4 TaxID=218160 RepID=UPI001CDBDA16|nr:sensor histidine kinase [Arthrobacter sp. M4]MCA4133933.1 PAS domain-containing sensor histidine kinase [Arthrobacter sp. M4]
MKVPVDWNIGSGKVLFFRRAFHEYTLTQRVVLSQLPLTVTTGITALLVAAFFPATMSNILFISFLVLQALALVLCYAVPWDRLPYPSFLSIPILDLVSISIGREGGSDALTGISLMAVLPIIWLCASGLYPRLAIAASFFAPLAIIWIPLFVHGSVTPQDLSRSLLLPIMMLGIGVSVSVLTQSMMQQQRDLESRDEQLEKALSESQQQRQLLNTVLETVHLGVLAVDADGHDVLMNRKQRKNHELASPQEIDDPNESQLLVFDLDRTTPVPPEERPVRRAVLGQEFTDYLVWLGQGPAQRAITTSARSIKDTHGNFAGSVIVFSDVTELVNALAAKDDFVANVSHEFRTPLTSILGYINLMLEEQDEIPGDVLEQLWIIRRNAERLLSLVTDLLSTRAGQVMVLPHAVNVTDLVRNSVDSARPKADDGGVRLLVSAPERLEAHVDPSRIGQVLDNLISNAIKYSPYGGDVTVTLRAEDGKVVCQVADSGIGMDEKDQAEAFTKFFRAGRVRNSKIPGVGLGLPITKAIIEAHGGNISLDSKPGHGTTFTFTVPA